MIDNLFYLFWGLWFFGAACNTFVAVVEKRTQADRLALFLMFLVASPMYFGIMFGIGWFLAPWLGLTPQMASVVFAGSLEICMNGRAALAKDLP